MEAALPCLVDLGTRCVPEHHAWVNLRTRVDLIFDLIKAAFRKQRTIERLNDGHLDHNAARIAPYASHGYQAVANLIAICIGENVVRTFNKGRRSPKLGSQSKPGLKLVHGLFKVIFRKREVRNGKLANDIEPNGLRTSKPVDAAHDNRSRARLSIRAVAHLVIDAIPQLNVNARVVIKRNADGRLNRRAGI